MISSGQEWAKIGPVLGLILAQSCARYGLLSVRDWNGLRLGQYWDSFGPILCQYAVPDLVSCYGEERVLYETYLDMDSWELPSTGGGGSSISMEKDPIGFGMGLKGCCLYHKKIPADRLRPLYSYIG